MKYNAEVRHANGMKLDIKDLQFITDGTWKYDTTNFHEFVMLKNSTYTFMGDEEILCIAASDIQYISISKYQP